MHPELGGWLGIAAILVTGILGLLNQIQKNKQELALKKLQQDDEAKNQKLVALQGQNTFQANQISELQHQNGQQEEKIEHLTQDNEVHKKAVTDCLDNHEATRLALEDCNEKHEQNAAVQSTQRSDIGRNTKDIEELKKVVTELVNHKQS